ncbi:MAG: FAD-dependent oxidoreductase [bacterium]|nr:FAD-dependent oxidoreductase [bacterium]
MEKNRILEHPILPSVKKESIYFKYNNKVLEAQKDEMISTALFANGIKIFGKHPKDEAEQGIFCANGQCAQCLVVANGKTVKSCITKIECDMEVFPVEGIPQLPEDNTPDKTSFIPPKIFKTEVFIMGGGPAGLSAAIDLASSGVKVILADDKHILGGKLGLQTHNFFGSVKDCYAGIRGIDIGTILTEKVNQHKNITVWLNSPVVGLFSDKKIGVVKDGKYVLVQPEYFLVAAGAREKVLAFPGSDLPGIYGAGAFQTLVNRDLIKAADKLFIVGGGNVGLIAAYHALQAGINVLGLVEAMPQCGGYKVHLDKIKRLGIPIWTKHTVLKAEGKGKLEKLTIAEVDKNFKPVKNTEMTFELDTLLIATGLSPINEMTKKAEKFGMKVYSAGDADTIAEASAALFGGKITARKILIDMKRETEIPEEWYNTAEILQSRPGKTVPFINQVNIKNDIYPVIRCTQEIPCNPCVDACSMNSISLKSDSIMSLPEFHDQCTGCGKCVAICPGLAITIVNKKYDLHKNKALVVIPWEFSDDSLKIGEIKTTTGFEGEIIGKGKVIKIQKAKWLDRRKLVHLEVPYDEADLIACIKIKDFKEKTVSSATNKLTNKDIIICRCERVSKKLIEDKIRAGCNDFNALKAELRIGMGACGGKNCSELIWKIFRECSIDESTVQPNTYRPLEFEVPLYSFLNEEDNEK